MVFGVLNAVMGELVHAAVVLRPLTGSESTDVLLSGLTGAALIAWCRNLLANYKASIFYPSVEKLHYIRNIVMI